MTLNLSGLLLAGTIWMIAAVLAWPMAHPTIAVSVLIGQAVGHLAVAIWGASTTVRTRSGRDPRTGR
jgi:hypothetical protein